MLHSNKCSLFIALVSKPDSWLGRNYLYVQFGWLFVGLCGRILFFNADRLVLALWILFTIAMAIAVGYFYGGKSWCQYFCPMAPVQTIFSEPGGLLTSKAHMSDQKITQSMCRTVLPDGNEQSACVACQSPCFDIDSERAYWHGLNKPEVSLVRYGYVGLVIGYFVYYYLYAGNWDYYFSGAWNREPDQLASLMSPGLYLFGQAINIPKLFAVPLVLGGFTAIGYAVGRSIETYAKSYRRHHTNLAPDLVRHRIFAVCTFGIFNFFFLFAGRPLIQLLPSWMQYGFDVSLVFLSTLWLHKTWQRNPDLYSRENLASRFRKQLEKLQLDVSQFLDDRSLDDLHANEVYVLTKVLPGFTREKRHEAYKGVVREALDEGYVNYSSSLEVLQQMRQELGITDDEHREVLEELGIEDPELLNPNRQRSLENQIRLSGYQKSLERLIRLRQMQPDLRQPDLAAFDPLLPQDSAEIRALRREYSITAQEEDWILSGLAPNTSSVQKAVFLLVRLAEWIDCDRALHQPLLQEHQAVLTLLQASVQYKQKLVVRTILATLATLQNDPNAITIAQSLQQLAPQLVTEHLEPENWRVDEASRLENRLHPEIVRSLTQPEKTTVVFSTRSAQESLSDLELLLQQDDPLVQAAALYVLNPLDADRAQTIAHNVRHASHYPLVQDTAEQILSLPNSPPLTAFPTLEKLVYLFNSDFFHRIQTETLMALADRSRVKTYSMDQVITEAGDTCRELLLLIEGDARIHYQFANEVRIEHLHSGQMLDELEVLTHSNLENTIIAESEKTRILAIPVDAFDDLLEQDSDFARRVLALESRHLQRLVRSMP